MNLIIYVHSYAEHIIEELSTNSESETFANLIDLSKQIEVIIKFHANDTASTQHTITVEPICPYNIKHYSHNERLNLIKKNRMHKGNYQ